MTGSTYDNGVIESRTFGTDNTLTAINFGGTGTAIGNLAYGWDANKNKTSESIAGHLSFTKFYDGGNRRIKSPILQRCCNVFERILCEADQFYQQSARPSSKCLCLWF